LAQPAVEYARQALGASAACVNARRAIGRWTVDQQALFRNSPFFVFGKAIDEKSEGKNDGPEDGAPWDSCDARLEVDETLGHKLFCKGEY